MKARLGLFCKAKIKGENRVFILPTMLFITRFRYAHMWDKKVENEKRLLSISFNFLLFYFTFLDFFPFIIIYIYILRFKTKKMRKNFSSEK